MHNDNCQLRLNPLLYTNQLGSVTVCGIQPTVTSFIQITKSIYVLKVDYGFDVFRDFEK